MCAVENIGKSVPSFQQQLPNLRSDSLGRRTVLHLLTNKTLAVEKHLFHTGKTYGNAVRFASACHEAMAFLDPDFLSALVRAAVAPVRTAVCATKAGSASSHVEDKAESASVGGASTGRSAAVGAVAGESADSDVVLVGVSLAKDNPKLVTAESLADEADLSGEDNATESQSTRLH
eukprot:TRINITY_DN6912_c0_g1_i4.p2 TRINITY_DN6912_c0_g1~~TRINITY_DN6912_c0_g1_i4.p2  ORF type:complete len:176 (+),score=26.44 TRINITY_DN6912_c0_g1_i4:1067-1594(+)